MAAGLTWNELVASVQSRQNERSGVTAGVTAVGTDIPYTTAAQIETILREVSTMKLREIPQAELEAIGNDALVSASFVNGQSFPLTAIKILGSRIDGNPAVRVQPAMYYQNRYSAYAVTTAAAYKPAIFFFGYGKVFFNGSVLTLTYLIEPPLSDYQADIRLLPPKYDEERIELTHQIVEAIDHLPHGRL